jgi:hypothetical protein
VTDWKAAFEKYAGHEEHCWVLNGCQECSCGFVKYERILEQERSDARTAEEAKALQEHYR